MKPASQAEACATVRVAGSEEYAACRMLLPLEADRSWGAQYLVAAQDQPPYIVGAASYVPETRATHGIRLRVIRTHRRRGIGRRMLQHIEELSRAAGAEFLVAAADSIQEPDAAPFFEAHGFTFAGRSTAVQASGESIGALILPVAERMLKRVSHRMRIVPLSEAPRTAVTALYKTELARTPQAPAWSLLGSVSEPRFAQSPVLMEGDRVAGFLLFQILGNIVHVPARVVAPSHKGGPANVLLIADAFRKGLAAGASILQFEIPEDNADTEKLARRLDARTVRTRDRYMRSLL